MDDLRRDERSFHVLSATSDFSGIDLLRLFPQARDHEEEERTPTYASLLERHLEIIRLTAPADTFFIEFSGWPI